MILTIALLIALFFVFDLGQYLHLQNLKDQQTSISALRQTTRCSVHAFLSSFMSWPPPCLPGAALLTLAGGAVFGLLSGTVIFSLASTAGATLAFLMSRFLLRDWVSQRFGQRLTAIDEGVRREGGFYLFTLRLVPLPSSWSICCSA